MTIKVWAIITDFGSEVYRHKIFAPADFNGAYTIFPTEEAAQEVANEYLAKHKIVPITITYDPYGEEKEIER